MERLARCRWPLLEEPYRAGLRAAVEYIFGRWEPVGIVAAGTIIRGNPAPSSDLDLYVVHTRPERQRVQKFFNGVPAEIFVNPRDRVERYFETDKASGRLAAAHMFATGFVVYQADDTVERLRARAAEVLASRPDPSPQFLTRRRYFVATSLEDAVDVAETDPEVCTAILFKVVEGAVQYRLWEARQWQPRYKDTLRALQNLD